MFFCTLDAYSGMDADPCENARAPAIEIESSFRVIDSLGLLLFTISFGNLFVQFIAEFSGKFCKDSAINIER